MELNPPPGSPLHTPDMPDRPVALPIRPTPLLDLGAVRQVVVPDWLEGPGTEPAARRPAGPPVPGPALAGPALAGPGGWPLQFAQVLAETLAGSRPAQQLAPWTTDQTRQRIRELGPVLATSQRPRVRRIMTSAPAANVLEMTAVVRFGPRIRVLALRLERASDAGSSWQCTALESA